MRGLLLVMVLAAGCSRPLAQARTQRFEPPTAAELDARERRQDARCSDRVGALYPGIGQLCNGETGAGATLAAVTTVELGTGIAVGQREGYDHPGAALPLLGASDLWVYSLSDMAIDRDLARGYRFTPADSLTDLLAAPFNWQVMKRPDVILGLVGMLGAGIGVSLLVDEAVDRDAIGDDPNLFGRTVDRRVGYPLGFGAQAALFYQVAIAEETAFRGWLQSSLARSHGETRGWLEASAAFGLVHAPNIFFLPREQWRDYLLYGVPFITALGSYIGWVYRRADYSMAPSVALHFWYDLLLSSTFFVLDPQNSPLSARLGWSF